MKKSLFIIDGYNMIFRMFYAVPEFRTRDGVIVNAIFGMAKGLLQILREDQPTHMVAAFDVGGDTFRKEMYEDYKSNRDKMPDSLSDQIEPILEVFRLLGIPMIGIPGYEADDIVGSFTNYPHLDEFDRVLILSSDKDLFQFIDQDKFRVYDMMKKKLYTSKEAVEKFGVEPKYVVDYLALVGDTSDMIPGVAGIGPKGASTLINTYGNLEQIYEHLDDITGSTHDKLVASRDIAFLSKKLATIDTSIDLSEMTVDAMACESDYTKLFTPEFLEFLESYEFKSLIPADMMSTDEQKMEFEDVQVTDEKICEQVVNLIQKTQKISLRTTGGRTTLDTLSLAFDTKSVYTVATSHAGHMRKIIDTLLAVKDEKTIIGYDSKMDLRRMLFFLEKTGLLADEEVMTLF